MSVAELERILQILTDRRDATAARWYEAIARTSFVPFDPDEVRQRLAELTDRASRVLLSEPLERDQARAIGAALAQLRYVQPDALQGMLEALAEHLQSGLEAEHALALQPRRATLLAGIAAGFHAEARSIILEEQEQIRAALSTAQREAEAALWASEARFRAIFDAAAIGIGLSELNGEIFETNRALQTMLGYSAEELRRLNVTEFTHPDDRATDWELYRGLVAGQRNDFAIVKRFYRKDGRLVWCHLTASIVRDAEGRPRFSIALMEDITARTEAQEAVRELHAQLERRVTERTAQLAAANRELGDEVARRGRAEAERVRLLAEERAARAEAEAARQRLAFLSEASRLLASSLDYVTTLERVAQLAVPTLADWCFVDVAAADGAIRRLAVAHADPSKGAWAAELKTDFPPPADGPPGPPSVLRTGQPELIAHASGRLELLLPSTAASGHLEILRQINPISWMVVPLMARARTFGAITLVSAESGRRYSTADLTLADDLARRAGIAVDNARLYQEAQDALAARDEFLSVAAHELKTPTTSLVNYAGLALRQLDRPAGPDPARLRLVLGSLDREATKFGGLVSQLLDRSRIDAGQLALTRVTTDLTRLVEDAAARARIGTRRHTIAVRAPASVPALVDPLRIEQVLGNLLSNAIKYSPSGGTIEVELSRPGPQTVAIAVRDHGIGIPAEHRQRLFERSYRVQPGDHVAGMGLGLFIARQIVDAHGGGIAVEAPADGGSRFVVTLPVGDDRDDAGPT